MDISADVHGNLYTSDHHNSCIQVFSADGVFLRTFGHDIDKLKSLLWGVCVSGQYVYVTDYKNHRVSVFTTDGVYITSFGQHGNKVGEFNIQCYLCIDKDSFIYVCDFHNNRIQCFFFKKQHVLLC